MAIYAIGGLLRHAPSILAFTCPTTNSYKRLVPGFEAPVNLAYSQRNRSASIRIPMYSPSPKAKRVEFRCPDPTCNPYLSFSAILMAMIDGIQNKFDPGDPLDKDIYDLSPEEMKDVPIAGRGPRRPAQGPRLPAPRLCVHGRRDRHLDLVQDGKRGGRPAPAPPPLRVLPLLRAVIRGRRDLLGGPCSAGPAQPGSYGHLARSRARTGPVEGTCSGLGRRSQTKASIDRG